MIHEGTRAWRTLQRLEEKGLAEEIYAEVVIGKIDAVYLVDDRLVILEVLLNEGPDGFIDEIAHSLSVRRI